MKLILYIFGGIVGVLFLLCIVYFLLLIRIKNINKRIYKKEEELDLKDRSNVLIIYQPSKHKTTAKIKDIIKNYIINKEYGYKITTLTNNEEDYSKYVKVIFIMPVYFGEVHLEFLNKLNKNKIKNLSIIYNGLNQNSDNEDNLVKKYCISRYSKIKLHTKDIEDVISFLNKEGF